MFSINHFELTGRLSNANTQTTTSKIQVLESYLSSLGQDDQQLTHSSSVFKLPITELNSASTSTYSIDNEKALAVMNLAICYNNRSVEINRSIIEKNLDDGKLWLSSFKLTKKSIQLISSVPVLDNLYETSSEFVQFIRNFIDVSSQQSFLTKSLQNLKLNEFNVVSSGLNYSSLSRIAVYIHDRLQDMAQYYKYDNKWLSQKALNAILQFSVIFKNTLLSIDFYKQNKIGFAIGYLQLESAQGQPGKSGKLKIKLKKIRSNFNIKPSFLKFLQPQLVVDFGSLAQLIDRLEYALELENKTLAFEGEIDLETLRNSIPSGRKLHIETNQSSYY